MVKSKLTNIDNLDDVFNSVDKLEQKTIDIDISKFLPDDKESILVFREPAINELYSLDQATKSIRSTQAISGNDMPQELCSMIALLAACHVSPKSVNQLNSYVNLSKHNWRAFQYIVTEFNNGFSYLANLDKAIQDSKND